MAMRKRVGLPGFRHMYNLIQYKVGQVRTLHISRTGADREVGIGPKARSRQKEEMRYRAFSCQVNRLEVITA